MPASAPAAHVFRFEGLEVDLRAGELRKNGERLKLQEQPLQILRMLLERPGETVTREEIQKKLWPTDTFVEFDHSINAAIQRLRQALGDSAENPRFVETMARRGYRFIAPVAAVSPPADAVAPVYDRRPGDAAHRAALQKRFALAGVSILAIVAALLALNAGGLRDRVMRAVGASRPVGTPAPKIQSLAVLPLENLSGDPDQEYFADGMTDALITDLGQISALRVISRQSMMRYKGSKKPLPEIAKELNVDALVEGAVLRSGDRVRITANLIHAASDRHLWAEAYDRDLRDVLVLQSDVAQAIAREVRIKLTPQEKTRFASARPVNPEAYQLYMRGRYHWSRWPEGWDKAIESFQQATERDPTFAAAYAGFAILSAYQSFNKPREEVYAKTRAAALKAVELDPTLSDAHLAMALTIAFLDWDLVNDKPEVKLAIELNPSNAEAHGVYGIGLVGAGRPEEGIAAAKSARQLDPFSTFTNLMVVKAYMFSGRYREAVEEAQKALELDPNHIGTLSHLAESYALLGMYDEALAVAEKMQDDCAMVLMFTFGASGRRKQALDCIGKMEAFSKKHYMSPFWMAVPYAGLGDNDRVFELLDRAYQERCGAMAILKIEPYFHRLHSDPRFQALLRRMNFPPQQ
jgi:TolB-like protein/DNA-binding winged helix-turn-helix (wHTH) protein